ncbi:hypothetical protein MPH47_06230 [Psychrobacillus psychrodurans]|uniref:hypothetical protein n=1 Tax=Psychrobacillus psychrodurans TaxID=126157 RepID=UPI001F4DF3F4|nr:hypothetical protein [Psychrobacillus psychrodurans]MCK1996828.1 hypothetical protein [Psychrobacillus psychrodurans]
MEINLKVEVPGLVEALESLAVALANQPKSPLPTSALVKDAKKETAKKETPKKTEELVEEQMEDTNNDAPEITLVTVRSYLQKLQDAGRQKDAKAILVDLGHKKLSDVPEDDYPVIIAKVEELLG